jgi:hypothetical protein
MDLLPLSLTSSAYHTEVMDRYTPGPKDSRGDGVSIMTGSKFLNSVI